MGPIELIAGYSDSRKLRTKMQTAACLVVWVAVLAGSLGAAPIRIAYQVKPISGIGAHAPGDEALHYTYLIDGLSLEAGQALDIEFDPAKYDNLQRGLASPGFDLLLLQPDNPPGTAGVFSLLALVDDPSFAGPFGVDFIYVGAGEPGSQRFFINQYDDSGAIVATLASGVTVSPVPEPATFALGAASLSLFLLAVRRRTRSAA